jgi:hypothetical protein
MKKPELNENKLTIEVFNKLLGEGIVEVRKRFIGKNIPMHKIVDGKIVAINPIV